MSRVAWEFVAAYPICACGKSSHSSPAGQLCRLPIPIRPWSHAVYFITGLPPSQGNNVILNVIVIDCFSKSVHYIPLPKLPSALETTNHMVVNVFKAHGISQDII